MTLPLIVLAFLSFAGGFLFDVPRYLSQFFPVSDASGQNALLQIVAASVGAIGILLAVAFYLVRPGIPEALARNLGGTYTLVYNKFFVDEIYDAAIVQPTLVGSRTVLLKGVDRGLLDGIVSGTGETVRGAGEVFRQIQSGNIRSYATWVVLGSVFVLILVGIGVLAASGVVIR
jgi:NADH-quinone oxidoreductase subunit L